MTTRSEAELLALRKLAEQLAQRRNERTTTGHLLAAIASGPSMAADLLHERRLDEDVLLRAARVLVDDQPDAINRSVQRAREFCSRAQATQPGALHLLFALCQDRTTAAMRALEQCGTDVVRLRTSAMQIAMGIAPARRTSPPTLPPSVAAFDQARREKPSSAPKAAAVQKDVVVPAPAPLPLARKTQPQQPAAKRVKSAQAASRFDLDPKRFPVLASVGKNLTAAAARGELDPVVGRDDLIESALDVLAKRHSACPCLVGVAGVGKTSVVRGLALRIAEGKDVASLDDRTVIEIEPASLVAGTGVRGSLAERIVAIKNEVKQAEGKIVVFFDEIHTLFGPDAGDEAATELKVALARGELPCIGATTFEEYKKHIEPDAALARRFTAIEVDEPTPEEAFLALEGLVPSFEKHHGTTYAKEAIAASVTWSVRYVPSRALPDKAIAILDLAGARARRRQTGVVMPEHVAEVVSEMAHVPLERLMQTDGERMLTLESLMAERVVGHSEALARVAAVLRRNASGFRSRRPIGSFLLLGPTGVGKTETAKAIAECLFFSADAMTRLDMSEYAEPHAIARLVGAPPGYVGHESGGQLTEAVRRRPYQVILLDEIEKAHRDVLEGFLQVFDEGRLTDGRGRTIDFTNTVLILTSNLGSEIAVPKGARGRIGFGGRGREEEVRASYSEAVVAAARTALPPELYNRIDEVLSFAPLTRADVSLVARRMLEGLQADLILGRGIKLDVSDDAIEALLDQGGYDPELGARPMRRAIARLVEAPIADLILKGEVRRDDVITVDAEGGAIVVDAITPRVA